MYSQDYDLRIECQYFSLINNLCISNNVDSILKYLKVENPYSLNCSTNISSSGTSLKVGLTNLLTKEFSFPLYIDKL